MNETSDMNSFYGDALRLGFEWQIVDPETRAIARIQSGATDSGARFDSAIRRITSDISEINELQLHACQKEPCELFRKAHRNLHDLKGFNLRAPIEDFMMRESGEAIKPVLIRKGKNGLEVTVRCEADVFSWKERRSVGRIKAARWIQMSSGEVHDDIRFEPPSPLPHGYRFEVVDPKTRDVTVLEGSDSCEPALDKALAKLSSDPEEIKMLKKRALKPKLERIASLAHSSLPSIANFTHKHLPLDSFILSESADAVRRVTISRSEKGIEISARTQLDVRLRNSAKEHIGLLQAVSCFDLSSKHRRSFVTFEPASSKSWFANLLTRVAG